MQVFVTHFAKDSSNAEAASVTVLIPEQNNHDSMVGQRQHQDQRHYDIVTCIV